MMRNGTLFVDKNVWMSLVVKAYYILDVYVNNIWIHRSNRSINYFSPVFHIEKQLLGNVCIIAMMTSRVMLVPGGARLLLHAKAEEGVGLWRCWLVDFNMMTRVVVIVTSDVTSTVILRWNVRKPEILSEMLPKKTSINKCIHREMS